MGSIFDKNSNLIFNVKNYNFFNTNYENARHIIDTVPSRLFQDGARAKKRLKNIAATYYRVPRNLLENGIDNEETMDEDEDFELIEELMTLYLQLTETLPSLDIKRRRDDDEDDRGGSGMGFLIADNIPQSADCRIEYCDKEDKTQRNTNEGCCAKAR